ncbi:MAG: TAXI family TRAP transporter solute-binding subunit [Bacillota bacterium]
MRSLVGLILGITLLAGCAGETSPARAPAPPGTLRIATATRAGVYYPLGQAMSVLWKERLEALSPAVLLTAGSPENIRLLMEGEAEVAFAQSGVVYATVNRADAKGVRSTLRGLTHLYPNVIQVLVRRDSGIRGPQDLRGKRFAPGKEGSATLINSQEWLALYGLTLEEMTVLDLGYDEAAKAVLEGRADAALIAGGIPTLAVEEMLASGQVEMLPLDATMVVQRYPWYTPFTVPRGSYKGLTEDVRTVAVANILIVRDDMPEQLAYDLVRSLYEGREELHRAHPAADLKVEQALQGITGVVPLHPGAARYLQQAGILP